MAAEARPSDPTGVAGASEEMTLAPRDWTSLARPTPGWFRRAKLGFFIHWGAYSIPAWAEPTKELGTVPARDWFTHNPYAEWYANTIRIPGSPAARHHAEVWQGRPYADFLDFWHLERFDAAELIRPLAAVAGQYVVFTTKHHDGICLWNAPDSHGRNTVERGPGRNLVAEVASATRAAGLAFGAYYSGGLDWLLHPGRPVGLDDTFEITERPIDAAYASYVASHIRDLVRRYAPDILWNDIDWPNAGKDFGPDGLGTVLEEYYCQVPQGVVNDRWHVPHSDFRTSEYQHQLGHEHGVWENCRGLGLSFSYNALEDEHHALSGPEAARHLVDVVSRGGRFNLGVGPRADGSLPSWQLHVLDDLAQWTAPMISWLQDASPVQGARARGSASADGVWLRVCRHPEGLLVFADGERDRVELPPELAGGDLICPEWGHWESTTRLALDADRPGPVAFLKR